MTENNSVPDSLSTFVAQKDASEWTVQLINPTKPEPMQKMAENLFRGLDADLSEMEIGGIEDDQLLVIRDGKVVASSSLKNIENTLLLVNSDFYITGTTSLDEIIIPDAIEELSDTVFTLTGYPDANTEKLVLTLVSRHVEQQAVNSQTGTLRSSFQQLSRLDDEKGTRQVYEQLGQLADLDTHVYGIPDWIPPSEMGLTVHRVRDDELRNTWFVVHRTKTGTDWAMLAIKDGANTWNGYWTSNTAEIQAIDDYILQTF
jgi:hypothetical protein